MFQSSAFVSMPKPLTHDQCRCAVPVVGEQGRGTLLLLLVSESGSGPSPAGILRYSATQLASVKAAGLACWHVRGIKPSAPKTGQA